MQTDLKIKLEKEVQPYRRIFSDSWTNYELALENFVRNHIASGEEYEEQYADTRDFLVYREARDPDLTLPWKIDVLWDIIQMKIYDQENFK